MPREMTSSTSKRLIDSAAAGSDDAINKFCERYWPLVFEWAKKYPFVDGSPEDVAQNVLIRVIPNLHQYDRAKGRFRSWLAKITQNCAIDMIKDQDSNPRMCSGDSESLWKFIENENAWDPGSKDQELLELRENSYTLADAIREAFDEDTWFCFTGMTLLGLSAAEIGASIVPAISADAVRARKARVVKKLRKMFENQN